jgi:hypothetical protein
MKPVLALGGAGLALCLFFAAPAHGFTAADQAWIATCEQQLKDENPSKRIVHKYCVCMHGFFEDNAPVDQSQRERMVPDGHLYCNRKAGWEPGPPPG